MSLKEQLDKSKIPQHVAIIMDGNGRWAKQRQHDRTFGHESGVLSVKDTVEAAAEIGIKYLTLYAFSSENWNRPKSEVDALMGLLVKTINQETKTLNDNNIRLQAIGDLQSLEPQTYSELQKAIENTASNSKMTLILALSYSSRQEITNAIQQIAQDIKNNNLQIEEINQNLVSSFLNTSNYPDPELLIRTSGEYRISNFLLWQIAYTELYFTPILWPDFRKENLYEAILDYQNRERRFGMTSEQLLNF
ncbi:MAG: isoprenyl transferase [Bacteroidetes bacterium]|nr:isoprenyl transferase [Bacteroidota bacterium]